MADDTERPRSRRRRTGSAASDAELELKSRELRIAMFGLIATVVVGLAGTIGTVVVTTTNQRASTRDRRLASDLAELREVSDRALSDMGKARSEATLYINKVNRLLLATKSDPRPALPPYSAKLTAAAQAVATARARLRIRLGRKARMYVFYDRSFEDLRATLEGSQAPDIRRAVRLFEKSGKELADFSDQATSVLGSRLK